MINDFELAWLAGIIDGEGSISTETHIRKNNTLFVKPLITISNSDKSIIGESERILKMIGVKYQLKSFPKGEIIMNIIRIEGMKQVEIFLPIILPFIRSRKLLNGNNLIIYINSRRQRAKNRIHNEHGYFESSSYTKDELKLICSTRFSKLATPLTRLLTCSNVIAS